MSALPITFPGQSCNTFHHVKNCQSIAN